MLILKTLTASTDTQKERKKEDVEDIIRRRIAVPGRVVSNAEDNAESNDGDYDDKTRTLLQNCTLKNICALVSEVPLSKNAEFDADFKSVEKLKNFHTKKFY